MDAPVLSGYEVVTQLSKRLYLARRGDERFVLKTFEAEPPPQVASAARLTGPWVAEVHEVGLFDTRHAAVCEWVDGVPLSQLVATGGDGPKLPQSLALYVSFQVARAVTAAHELDDGALLHGAIDLTHVLCARDGAVKVCNFGGGALRGQQLRAQVGFVAPEVLGTGALDVLSDVYACGALAYCLLTGRTPAEAALAYGGGVPAMSRLAPMLSPQLDYAVLESVAQDPGERAFSPRVLTAAIDRCAEELGLDLEPGELALRVAAASVAPARAA